MLHQIMAPPFQGKKESWNLEFGLELVSIPS
jgi:hypothetical protein